MASADIAAAPVHSGKARVNKHKADWRGWKFMWPFAVVSTLIWGFVYGAKYGLVGSLNDFLGTDIDVLAPSVLLASIGNIVTTALFTIVATWNNYFLPLIMLKDADWYPLTIGLNQWKDQASTAGGQAIQNLVITGSLITIIPLVIAFLCLQKYWQSGLAAGAVKE